MRHQSCSDRSSLPIPPDKTRTTCSSASIKSCGEHGRSAQRIEIFEDLKGKRRTKKTKGCVSIPRTSGQRREPSRLRRGLQAALLDKSRTGLVIVLSAYHKAHFCHLIYISSSRVRSSAMSAQQVLAAALVEPGKYEVREYPLPEPGSGCVLVKMEMSGICGTDKHTYQGFTTQYAGAAEGKQIRFPIIQGHENVGTVAAIGGNGEYSRFRRCSAEGRRSSRLSARMYLAASATTAATTFLIISAKT